MFNGDKIVLKTRQDYNCNGCRDLIPKGSSCVTSTGKFQGEFYYYRICNPCDDFLKSHPELFEDGWCEGDIGYARTDYAEELI